MIKNLSFILLIVFLIPFSMRAEWVTVNTNKTANTPPEVSILSDDNNSTVLKIDLAGFKVNELLSEGKTYQTIDLLNDIFTTEVGSPALPYVSKVLAIPDHAAISIEVIETGEVQTFENIYLPPARPSWIEGKPEPAYDESPEAYVSTGLFPQEYVSVEPPSIFRDFRIARVSVYPLRYIPAKKELQVVSSITVKINYGKGEVVNPKIAAKREIAPAFGELYRSFIFNYQSVLDGLYDGKEEGREVMLCIMPDEFTESFQVYADWKRESGTDIHVTAFSDIGANSNNADIIKDHISDAYYNWEYPPTYVLIIGDDGIFPKKIVQYPDYSFPNEDYFVEVEGDDFFPEMMIGRFTNQGDYRMQVMINKFMMYEKTPYVEETDWFTQGTFCSNNAYESQVKTKRFAAKKVLDYGFTKVDTMMSDGNGWGSGCTYDIYDVMGTLNDGRSYLNYRGEGWYYGWYASCYNFETSNVSSLSNGEKFTFVTSIGCGVAMFDSYGGNCFGEEWVQLGSLTDPRGGVAFVGPTSNTHTTYNNRIDRGIYTGMFVEGMDTPGQALLRGKLYMYNVFGADYYCEYHYKVFCVLGDPSLHVWKNVPLAVNVNHETSINVGNNELDFTVTFDDTGLPVENAQVCLTGEAIFETAFTDASGKAYINVMPEVIEELMVTVRGEKVYPYQEVIQVLQPQELVGPEADPGIVDMDGNLDDLINPNENCSITYTLKNWGSTTANSIEATLSTSNPDFVEIITSDPISFGDLNPGSSNSGSPFQFYVKPECPVGQEITLQLNVTTASDNSWNYDFKTDIHGCQLMYTNFIVKETGTANINYQMEPGESGSLLFSISNNGDDIASNIMGELTSSDPYITITDATAAFGALNIDGSAISEDDYFGISVSASCPADYAAAFTLELYTQDGNYPYQVNHNFELPVAMPIPADYTGPDAYGYYAYSSNDAFYDQTPVYNWVEIEELGDKVNVPYTSDYTQTVTLPFDFKYYGEDYTQIRISTDGWIAFGGGSETAPLNAILPSNDNVSSMVAAFWDDLYDVDFIDTEGDIYYYDDIDNHQFIVQWDSISHNVDGVEPQREVFQVILLDPAHYPTATGDGEIIIQYKNVVEYTSNTIGIENNSQDIGLQYVYNNEYDATASELMNDLALKFTTEEPNLAILVSIDENQENVLNSNGFNLEQNQPNPFSSSTWIDYTLPERSNVTISVYNVRGEIVCTLYTGEQAAGKHSVEWNATNESGKPVKSGIYFYRLQTENVVETKKMFLLK